MPNVTPSAVLRPQPTQTRNLRISRALHQHAPSSRPIPSQPQPTVTNDEGTKTLRLRQHGNRSLPLPPLMDPIAIAAKERHKRPKQEPEGRRLTEFQRQLAANPYAQALATPVRQCSITKARLPSHFLLPFSTVITSTTPAPRLGETKDPEAKRPQPVAVPSPASDLPAGTSSTGSSTYVLNRQSMLDHLTRRNLWSSIITVRMQDAYAKVAGKKNVKVDKEWSWDGDMPEKVLQKLRAEVVEHLKACLEDQAGRLVRPLHDVDIEGIEEEESNVKGRLGAIVDLDLEHGRNTEEGEQEAEHSTRTHGSKVITPVYNLRHLLGEDMLSQLPVQEGELRQSSPLAVLQHPRTVKLLLALDRLRMYMLPRDVQL